MLALAPALPASMGVEVELEEELKEDGEEEEELQQVRGQQEGVGLGRRGPAAAARTVLERHQSALSMATASAAAIR